MRKITLYWNNICVLKKMELEFLDGCIERLKEKGIQLKITGFGLGYPGHMSDYLRQPDAPLGDILVSTDLEVYEDTRVFDRFSKELYPINRWYDLKSEESVPQTLRQETLLPFLVIPLVLYSSQKLSSDGLSLLDCLEQSQSLAFGGINNSAAKSVVKTVWSKYGKETAQKLLEKSIITAMPVQAFQLAKTGQVSWALVPLLFALNTDQGSVICPSDGAVAVPSYISVRTSISQEDAKSVLDELLDLSFLASFVNRGKMVSSLVGSERLAWMIDHGHGFQLPSEDWLKEISPSDFYEMYCTYIPTADQHM